MKKLIIFLAAAFIFIQANAQIERIQAAFIYNFTKYLDWPIAYRGSDFIIGVYGSDKMYQELQKIAKIKKVGNQNIKVIKLTNVSDLQDLNMMYVSQQKKNDLPKAVKLYSDMPTVIITNNANSRYYDINFIVKNGKQRFQLNVASIRKKGIKIKDTLIKLAEKEQ